jgi:hypothetical protein
VDQVSGAPRPNPRGGLMALAGVPVAVEAAVVVAA